MRRAARKFGIALAILVLSFPLIRLSGWFALGIPVGLVLSILYWFDLAREIRNAPSASRALRLVGLLMGVPQALLGLLCVGIGLAVVVWVLYNIFVERQPHYTGGVMTLGIGPALILFGLGWVSTAFRRDAGGSDSA